MRKVVSVLDKRKSQYYADALDILQAVTDRLDFEFQREDR